MFPVTTKWVNSDILTGKLVAGVGVCGWGSLILMSVCMNLQKDKKSSPDVRQDCKYSDKDKSLLLTGSGEKSLGGGPWCGTSLRTRDETHSVSDY